MSEYEVRRALRAFSLGRIVVHKGDLAHVGHPIMEGREHLFGELKVKYAIESVESATAAPNEVRSLDLSHMGEEEATPRRQAHADMPLNVLREMASDLELPNYGTKAELAQRINKKLGE